MVERFEPNFDKGGGAHRSENGGYVRYPDYAKLAAENERLKIEIGECKLVIEQQDRDAEALSRTGAIKETSVMVCPQCEGEGSYADGLDEAACTTPCTRCDSNGWIVDLSTLEPAALAEPDFASTIAAVIKDECESSAAAGWRSCTGCHETNEGYETGRYPYSKMFGCYVGHGCSECGGLGVVWEYWPESALETMARDEEPVAPCKHPVWGQDADGTRVCSKCGLVEPAAPKGQQEPVATWQRRVLYPENGAKPQWEQCSATEATEQFARSPHHEYRPLFTRPSEQAAPEGRQEAVAWQSQDLIESVSYVSKNFGLVRYEGIDRYFGQSTHKFSTGHGARYVLPEALNDFLAPKPVARPSEQAVTEAGDIYKLLGELRQFVDAVAGENRPSREWAIKLRAAIDALPEAALKAAMEAGG